MCFTSRTNSFEIANKPITVYKIIRKSNESKFSYVRGFKYKEYNIHISDIEKPTNFNPHYYNFHVGFHSFINKPNYCGANEKIVKMIIPVGAWFIKNSSQYLTNLLITEDLNPIK